MVGETADAMTRHRCANSSVSSEVLAILSISPLTYLTVSEIISHMDTKKNPNAVALGSLGGKARAEKLSASKRKEIAQKAVAARNKSLSAADRKRIAKLAVEARERKRKLQGKEKEA
jgi:hypothetical protein